MGDHRGPGSAPPPFAAQRLAEGRGAFNAGAFFEAHEIWEEVWRQMAGPERRIVQGLIQIAAGCHHLQRLRPGPAARLLKKGVTMAAAAAFPEDESSLLFPDAALPAFLQRVLRLSTLLAGATDPDANGEAATSGIDHLSTLKF